MRVLVLGGPATRVVAEVRAYGDIAFAAGRDASKVDPVVDLREPQAGSYRAALTDVDVVVDAARAEDPDLARLGASNGAAFIDITATAIYVVDPKRLNPPRPVLVSVGLAQG